MRLKAAIGFAAILVTLSPALHAGDKPANKHACASAAPQTPRDISSTHGTNTRKFTLAPSSKELNLCNIHFHVNAEHKAPGFSLFAGKGKFGGYQCNDTPKLTKAELTKPAEAVCKGVKPGDTIEVHWVHSSCNVKPGKGLGSCLADDCKEPLLRVEAQAFLVVNDKNALDFTTLDYPGTASGTFHQAKAIPSNTGTPIVFHGSTTGPKYNNSDSCSPLKVTWSVRPTCTKVDINSLHTWCKKNAFEENYAHGVRDLVTDPAHLAIIE